MPPPDPRSRPSPPDALTSMLEEVHRLDPSIDLKPGSSVRALVEAAARAIGSTHDPRPMPGYGTNLSAFVPRTASREVWTSVVRGLLQAPPRPSPGLPRPLDQNMIGDCTSPSRPLTRADLERTRREIERWNMVARPPMLDPETARAIMGSPAAGEGERSRQLMRAREEIMAEEDRQIFRALDRAASEGTYAAPPMDRRAFEQEYMADFMVEPPNASNPPGWRMQELPGRVEVNPRAVERVTGRRVPMPEFEIQSSPRVHLDDIRERRFNMTERTPPPPQRPMDLKEMERVALIVRRTAWERLLAVPDDLYDFPERPAELPGRHGNTNPCGEIS